MLTDEERREKGRQRAREWYAANRERALQYQKTYRAANPELLRQKERKYRLANHDRIDKRVKEWHASHPERVREIKTKHSSKQEVRQRRAVYAAEYYVTNKFKKAEYQRAYRATNPDKIRAHARKNVRIRRARKKLVQVIPFTPEQLAAKVAYWGNRCWVCSGDWSEMDHVKPISAGGADALCNLRPICKPCNSSKNSKWPYPVTTVKKRK
jgi:5-methylcytosine-specific restriction endonuclease McrA